MVMTFLPVCCVNDVQKPSQDISRNPVSASLPYPSPPYLLFIREAPPPINNTQPFVPPSMLALLVILDD